MNIKTFLIIHSAVYGLFAIGLFAVPELIMRLFGVEINDPFVLFLAQDASVFLAGIAVLGILFRDVGDGSDVARKIVTAFLIMAVLGFALTLHAVVTGILAGPIGWTDTCLFAVLAILGFLQLAKAGS